MISTLHFEAIYTKYWKTLITNRKTSSLTVEWRQLSTTKFDVWIYKFRSLSCSWPGQYVSGRSHQSSPFCTCTAYVARVSTTQEYTRLRCDPCALRSSLLFDARPSSPFMSRNNAMQAVMIVCANHAATVCDDGIDAA